MDAAFHIHSYLYVDLGQPGSLPFTHRLLYSAVQYIIVQYSVLYVQNNVQCIKVFSVYSEGIGSSNQKPKDIEHALCTTKEIIFRANLYHKQNIFYTDIFWPP